jgi:hypothetical protein
VRTRAIVTTEYRMERWDGIKWVDLPLGIKLGLAAQKERLAVYSRENPTEVYRLAWREVTVTPWREVTE